MNKLHDLNTLSLHWLCKNIKVTSWGTSDIVRIDFNNCVVFNDNYNSLSTEMIYVHIPYFDKKEFYNEFMYNLSAYDMYLFRKYDNRNKKYNNHFADYIHKDFGRYIWEKIINYDFNNPKKSEYAKAFQQTEDVNYNYIVSNFTGYSEDLSNVHNNSNSFAYHPLPAISSFPTPIKNNKTYDEQFMKKILDDLKKDNLGLLDGISSWYYNDLGKEEKE